MHLVAMVSRNTVAFARFYCVKRDVKESLYKDLLIDSVPSESQSSVLLYIYHRRRNKFVYYCNPPGSFVRHQPTVNMAPKIAVVYVSGYSFHEIIPPTTSSSCTTYLHISRTLQGWADCHIYIDAWSWKSWLESLTD